MLKTRLQSTELKMSRVFTPLSSVATPFLPATLC